MIWGPCDAGCGILLYCGPRPCPLPTTSSIAEVNFALRPVAIQRPVNVISAMLMGMLVMHACCCATELRRCVVPMCGAAFANRGKSPVR
jgi:hypothetical protein